MNSLITNELELYEEYKLICGVDEAGRGPLAGPVVCSAVIFNLKELLTIKNDDIDYLLANLNDSKAISAKKREKLFPLIQEYAQAEYEITPTYKILSENGPDHNKTFEVGVFL